jgi:hypothetical protein
MYQLNNLKFLKALKSEFIIQLIPIPASIIFSRLLGPNDRGQLAEILLIPSIIATIISCNWDKILKGELLKNLSNSNLIINKTLNLAVIQIISITLIVTIFNILGFWANFLNPITAFFIALTIATLQLLYNYLISISSCILDSDIIYKVKISSVLFYFTIVCIYYIIDNISIYETFLLNQIIPLSTLLILFFKCDFFNVKMIKEIRIKFDNFSDSLKVNFRYVILDTLSNNIDMVILILYAKHEDTGAYLSFKIIEFPFKLISLSFLAAITPIFNKIKDHTLIIYNRIIAFSTIILGLILYTFSSFLNDLVIYVLGVSFVGHVWMIKNVLLVSTLLNLLLIFLNILMLNNETIKYNQSIKHISFLKLFLVPFLFYFYGVGGVFAALFLSSLFGIFIIVKNHRILY